MKLSIRWIPLRLWKHYFGEAGLGALRVHGADRAVGHRSVLVRVGPVALVVTW